MHHSMSTTTASFINHDIILQCVLASLHTTAMMMSYELLVQRLVSQGQESTLPGKQRVILKLITILLKVISKDQSVLKTLQSFLVAVRNKTSVC